MCIRDSSNRHLAETGEGVGDVQVSRFLLGSALPDFATMGRFRMTDRPEDPSVGAGVSFHHRTDQAFHSHPWFRGNSKAVSATLEEAGVNRGAAMACGHVGVELLLDGLLLDTEPTLRGLVEQAVGQLNDESLALADAVASERRDEWSAHLDSIARWSLPRDYRSPAAVAGRLHRILAPRRRLALGSEDVRIVTEVLTARQQDIESETGQLLDDLAADLADPKPAD